MPSNIKQWEKVKRTDFDLLIQNLRSKGFSPPYSDSGTLRSGARHGLHADVDFNEKEQALTVRIREAGRGETYASVFSMLETTIKATNR
jgi:hypothetical protein